MPGTIFNASNWGGYAAAAFLNPSSALSDFTLIIDIANMPAQWKAAVQSDGGDIRLFKPDGTELAFDLINWSYNAGSPTGQIRVKWSGTMATSGVQIVRVWAGHTTGSAVAYDPGETYGRHNAYASYWLGYWPNGHGTDRTSNGNDTTDTGTLSTVAGKIGLATDFENADASSSPSEFADTGIPGSSDVKALISWNRFDALSADNGMGHYGGFGKYYSWTAKPTGAIQFDYRYGGSSSAAGLVSASTWHHIVMTDVAGWIDGVERRTYSGSFGGATTFNFLIGTILYSGSTYQDSINGQVGQVALLTSRPSDTWIAQEYSQTNDNSSFWESWSWTANTPPPGHGGSSDSFNKLFGLASHSEDANLKIWLPCQDNAGTTVNDQSSNGIDGSLVGGDTTADISTTGPTPWLTRSLELDGTSARIDVSGATGEGFSAESSGHDLTILTRVYLDTIAGTSGTTADSQMIVHKGHPSNSGEFEWSLGTEGNKVWFRTNGGNTGGTSPDVSATTWLDIGARWDNGSNVTLHVDDSSNTIAVTDTSENNFNWGLVLGEIYYAANNFKGRYGEIIVFSRLLTTGEYEEWRPGPELENKTVPTISGPAQVGAELTCNPGTWGLPAPFVAGSNGTASFLYQWTRSDDALGTNEVNIVGATDQTYTPVEDDLGKRLRCYVRGVNDGGYDAAADTTTTFTAAVTQSSVAAFYCVPQAIGAGF